jgi:mannose/fructose/N-acetylgalactosamine-specific phosphotransferase system component IIC
MIWIKQLRFGSAKPASLNLIVRAWFNVSALSRKRPTGISVLAVALAWLAAAGFGNAIVWHIIPLSLLTQLPPGAPVEIFRHAATPLFSALAIAYGAAALYACVSLWRMRRVAARAFLWWSLSVVAVFVFFVVNSPRDIRLVSLVTVVLIFVTLVLWALHRYVLHAVSPKL